MKIICIGLSNTTVDSVRRKAVAWCIVSFSWIPLWYLMAEKSWAQHESPASPDEHDVGAGIEYQVILDCENVPFPDIVYGFVRVADTSGKASFLPFPGHDAFCSLKMFCGRPGFDQAEADTMIVASCAGPCYVAEKPPHAESVARFRMFELDSKFVTRLLGEGPCGITATTLLRPLPIKESLPGKKPSWQTRILGEGQELLLEDTAEINYEAKRTIFKDPDSELIKFALNPAAWLSRKRRGEIQWNNIHFERAANNSAFKYSQLISRRVAMEVPVLFVFPSRVDSIQELLMRDTTTWRFLEMARLAKQFVENPHSDEEVEEMVDAALDLLKQSGPAELFYLDKTFFRWIRSSSSDDPAVSGEEHHGRIMYFIGLWSSRIEKLFPRVNLHSKWSAPWYGENEKYLDEHDIDIKHVRELLAEFQEKPSGRENATGVE